MKFLSSIAKPFVSIFKFLESPRGQAIISAGEGVAISIDPALAPLINLANSWMNKVVATEQIAAAAGAQSGTGTQKAAAVLTAMGPEIAKYFPNATSAEIGNANTAIVAFLNAFSVGEPAPAAAVAGAGVGQK